MTVTAAHASVPVDRLAARETIFRLAAVLFGYPLAETQQALDDGRLHAALAPAWRTADRSAWPRLPPSPDLTALQVGYTDTFLHGHAASRGCRWWPAPTSAAATARRRATSAQRARVLSPFRPAGGPGRRRPAPRSPITWWPCSSSARCSATWSSAGTDLRKRPCALSARSARLHRRYLAPLLSAIKARFAKAREHGLDPTLAALIDALPGWVADQQAALSSQVGPCPSPRDAGPRSIADSRPLWD